MAYLPKTLLQFILFFLKPYKLSIVVLLLIGAIWAIDISVGPYILKMMIDRVSFSLDHHDLFKILLYPALGYIGMMILINISFRLWDYTALKTFPMIKAKIVMQLIRYIELHPHEYFQNKFSGALANKISDLNNGVETILRLMVNNFVPNVLALVIAAFTIASTHVLFLAVVSFWGILFFVVNIRFARQSERLFEDLSESRSTLTGKIVDSLTNMMAVRLFARQLYEVQVIKKQLKDLVNKDRKAQWGLLYTHLFQGGTVILLTGVILYLLIYLRQNNLITVGDFVLIMTLTFSISDIVKQLSNDYVTFSIYVGICKQALTTLNQPHSIFNKPQAKKLLVPNGKIEFKNVTFQYRKNDNLFQNQSITISSKEKVGLVGYSGSGKTTFVNLIIRLFEIQDGQILIDDQDITDVTQNSLRENIGFIPQDPVLFHRSIKDNIRYGNLKATDSEVVEAAKRAHAHEFIVNMLEGYNALVGERGVKLSGGQRQRVAIARAVIKNAPILILDEATSALDSVTESLIQDSLNDLMQNKTVMVIAHRLSTLLSMDRILVFDKGHIVEEGNHSELLEKHGLYYTLWNSQVGGFLPSSKP